MLPPIVYFALWAVFLLIAIIAVPVAAMMEKRKYQNDGGYAAEDVPLDDNDDDSVLAEDPMGDGNAFDDMGPQPQTGEGAFGDAEMSDDDFAAFN